MALASYQEAMKFELRWEGGKVDHPKDPGGRTNEGVTQRVFNGWLKNNNLPPRDVYQIKPSERDAIYRELYWKPIRGDDLPRGIDLVVFDGAVNSGGSQSVKWLQRALNDLGSKLVVDGAIGPATIAEIDKLPNHDQLVDFICDRRMKFLKQLKGWPTFGKGWTSRVAAVRKTGKLWARGLDDTEVMKTNSDGKARAPISDAKPVPTVVPADVLTGTGVAGGGILVALNEAKENLSPLTGSGGWIDSTLALITVATTVVVVAGIGWRLYSRHLTKKRADALDLPGGAASA